MAENPWDFSDTLLNAAKIKESKKAHLLEQGKATFEKLVKERDTSFSMLNDKTVQSNDDLYAYHYNKWAAIESKLNPGTKLPLVKNPTSEDRAIMESVAGIWKGVVEGKIPKDVGLKLAQQRLNVGLGAGVSDPKKVGEEFQQFMTTMGVGGRDVSFQDGDKDISAVRNIYGQDDIKGVAKNFEADDQRLQQEGANRDEQRLSNEKERLGLDKQRLDLDKQKAEKGDKGSLAQEEANRLKKMQLELQAAEKEVKAGKVKTTGQLLASFPLIGGFFKGMDKGSPAQESISQIRQQLQTERTGGTETKGKTKQVTSQAEYDALKPGDTYEWNGKTYTKK